MPPPQPKARWTNHPAGFLCKQAGKAAHDQNKIREVLSSRVQLPGARGPGFKSRRPDQIPQRVTDSRSLQSAVLESNWSPKWTPRAGPPVQSELTAPDFAEALSSCINPTFPTSGTETIDSFGQLLV